MARAKIPDEDKCVKISISFTPEQYKSIMQYCWNNERAISWVVRKALAEWLEKHKDDTI